MSQASALEQQMLELVNFERTSRGLDPVQLELRLNESSEDHSRWMLEQDVFSHTGDGGSSAGDRMRDAGFEFSGDWTWAENIAWQSEQGAPGLEDDVAGLHASLMNSPGHRANILNPDVEVIGIGIETGDFDGWSAVMVTQNFARTSAEVQLDPGTSAEPVADNTAPETVEDTNETEVAGDTTQTEAAGDTTGTEVVEETAETEVVEETPETEVVEETTETEVVEDTTETETAEETTETEVVEETTETETAEETTGTETTEETTGTEAAEDTTGTEAAEDTTGTAGDTVALDWPGMLGRFGCDFPFAGKDQDKRFGGFGDDRFEFSHAGDLLDSFPADMEFGPFGLPGVSGIEYAAGRAVSRVAELADEMEFNGSLGETSLLLDTLFQDFGGDGFLF